MAAIINIRRDLTRVVFNKVLKIIQICFDSFLLTYLIGLRKLLRLLNQSDGNHLFACLRQVRGLIGSHWFVVIGRIVIASDLVIRYPRETLL